MRFTRAALDALLETRPDKQHIIWDSKEPGLSVLVSHGPKHKRQATVTFRVVYYLPSHPGKPRYRKLERFDPTSTDLEDVRNAARVVRMDAAKGVDPTRPKLTGDFKEAAERFIEEHAKENRTWNETKRILDTYVVPEWADKKIEDIKKSDISVLLNRIAQRQIKTKDGKKLGTRSVARATRAQLVTLFNWWVDTYGSENFRSPIVKSAKTKQWKPRNRERVLSDDELRTAWFACNDMGVYGAAIKTALLTAQRFRKVGQMRRVDLKDHVRIQGRMEDGQWIADQDIGHVWDATRDNDPRNKRVSMVPLSRQARGIIAAVPAIDADSREHKDFVFTTTGRGPLKGWSKYKKRLDRKMLALLRQQLVDAGRDPAKVEFKPWQHRDLRRTARTMMARAGVNRDVSEHCLGHVLPGVEQVYDRYHYLAEKQEAFEKLADLIDRIVHPRHDSVVPMRA